MAHEYVRIEFSFDSFRLFLATCSLAFVAALCEPKVEQYCSLRFRLWYIRFQLNWQWFQDILLTVFCILSIGFIDADAGLLELTALQSVVILILCANYTFDLVSCFLLSSGVRWPTLNICSQLENIGTAHDIIGLIGCGYLLSTRCAGGMMVRLLLDILTNLLCRVREHFPQWFCGSLIRQWVCDKLFWIICIIVRLCYYPLVLVQTLAMIIELMSIADHLIHYYILFILITYWLVFSMMYHIIWIRDTFNSDNCHCH
jgi:hypothetical protein